MNKLFLKYLLEQKVSQENLAFINSIRSNSNLKPYSLHEVAAPPRRRPPTPGMMVNPGFNNGVPTQYQSNYQTGVAYDQFGNPIGWTASPAFLEMLKRHEGVRLTAYTDSQNRRAIGIGFDLETKENLKLLRQMYPNIDIDALLREEISLTMEQINALFPITLERALNDCLAIFPGFQTLPRTVQDVLVNMSFNLGRTKLLGFKKMIEAVNSGDWYRMAREMVNSKWYGQVGDRSIELVRIIREFAQQQQSGGTPPQQGGGGMPQRQAPPPKPPATAPPATGTTPPGGGGRR